MIWFLLATYYLGGGLWGVDGGLLTIDAVNRLGELSRAVIADPVRAEAAQATLKQLKKEIRGFERKFDMKGMKLTRAYKNHDSTEDDAFALLDGLNSEWEAMQSHAIDLRFQLRDQMTEDEWNELFKQD